MRSIRFLYVAVARVWPVLLLGVCASAQAQSPTLPGELGGMPGSLRSSLGRIPGAGGNPFGGTPGADSTYLGGRPGPSFPRVPSEITTPSAAAVPTVPPLAAPARVKITDVPLYGPLEIPDTREDEGPADGLTLDQAIERLVHHSPNLSTLSWQIPAAEADVLTAGLRANPILYADSQLVPYKNYSRNRPGGPTQYDLNINYPIDYSLKRLARIEVAARGVRIVEAEYQDAARVEIDNLYTIFVDLLAARETVRYARASQAGMRRLLGINQTLYEKSNLTRADVGKVQAMMRAADLGVLDAEAMLRRSRQSLAYRLNLPPSEAETLHIRGSIHDDGPVPPSIDELLRLAFESRPDLVVRRLAVGRSEANVKLARANRFADAYVLYQPYTFQNNAPYGSKSATSWALGLTAPIPLWNRNQGGVARSMINVEQTKNDVAALERLIASEVRSAEREYQVTREALQVLGGELVPASRQERDDTLVLFVRGELTAIEANNAQRNYNEAVRRYRDMLIRHRRSMLALNTAVGLRILP